jgi:hypothetical protein
MERMDYEQYEKDWFKRHKGSRIRPPRVSSWGLIGGILLWALIAIGAALVSGAHSVPAILQTIPAIVPSPFREGLSLFGFTIFELLIFAGAVYRRDNRYATFALLLAMVGALFANVGSSVVAVTQNHGDGLNYVVAFVLAIIAPMAAFLAGEMVHRLLEKHQRKLAEAFAEYDSKRIDLDKVINRDFTKYEKQFVQQTVVQSLSNGQSNGQNNGNEPASKSLLGHTKRPDASAVVQQYLADNPQDIDREARELAAFLGVGKSTVNNVQRQFRSNANGQNRIQ